MAHKRSLTFTLTAIIVIQFFLLPANAGLHGRLAAGERIILQEIAAPEAAGDYYRRPGKLIASEDENRWFGPEIDSRVLCPMTPHPFNDAGFFDIIYTREDAQVWPSSRPGRVWWYRKQEWRFATADTPWGTDTVYITLASEIGWTDIDSGNSTTGFPVERIRGALARRRFCQIQIKGNRLLPIQARRQEISRAEIRQKRNVGLHLRDWQRTNEFEDTQPL